MATDTVANTVMGMVMVTEADMVIMNKPMTKSVKKEEKEAAFSINHDELLRTSYCSN
jgi:hypothetical protein